MLLFPVDEPPLMGMKNTKERHKVFSLSVVCPALGRRTASTLPPTDHMHDRKHNNRPVLLVSARWTRKNEDQGFP